MSIVIELRAPWHWLPFVEWYIDDNNLSIMDKDFAFVVGWGPFQLFLMSYSPIAEGNSLKEVILSLVNGNEEKYDRLVSMTSGTDKFTRETFNRLVREIRDN